MIFVGDIALPYKQAIDFTRFPSYFNNKSWFGNMEGAIVKDGRKEINGVFNGEAGIGVLLQHFKFSGFALANNHIFDTGTIENTVGFLEKNQIKYGGVGNSLNEANKEILLHEDGTKIVIINFGWEVIQCQITTGEAPGVNPLRRNHVLKTVSSLVKKYPGAKVIPFMHWSYELEAEPQPFERELAKKMIEEGAAGVIGAHPHRIGGFEIYKGKPIVYSLGNWLFKQNYYYNGRLSFPDFCDLQLAFEWDFSNDQYEFHFFKYDREKSALKYVRTEGSDSETMREHTPFRGLSNKEYIRWYKKNHYHKNKGLPIYYWEDSPNQIKMKNRWNKIRDRGIKLLLNKGK